MGTSLTHGSWGYWIGNCHKDPAAVALAERLGLDLPRNDAMGMKGGLMYPMRRLVIAGEDTPPNMRLLFGPTWNSDNKRLSVQDVHKDIRKNVLMCPPSQSPAGMVDSFLDEGYNGPWRPRGASAEEEQEVRRQNDFMRQMRAADILP